MPDDWTLASYVRVFVTLPLDQPTLWAEDRLLAWYTRLLVYARGEAQAWPRDLPPEVQADLLQLGAVDEVGLGLYQVHGADRLRQAGRRRGQAGGQARAARYGRDAGGKLLGRGHAGELNGGAGPDAGQDAGPLAGQDAALVPPATSVLTSDREIDRYPAQDLSTFGPGLGSESTSPGPPPDPGQPPDPLGPSTVGEYRARVASHGPDDSACDEPDLHQLHHRWYAGVGWKCLLCEHSDSRTFRDRMEAAQAAQDRAEELAGDSPF